MTRPATCRPPWSPRAVIDQAKGILMERHKLRADQAIQLLAQASMNANRKVRDVADQPVHIGEVPVAPQVDGRRPGNGRSRGRAGPTAPEHP